MFPLLITFERLAWFSFGVLHKIQSHVWEGCFPLDQSAKITQMLAKSQMETEKVPFVGKERWRVQGPEDFAYCNKYTSETKDKEDKEYIKRQILADQALLG